MTEDSTDLEFHSKLRVSWWTPSFRRLRTPALYTVQSGMCSWRYLLNFCEENLSYTPLRLTQLFSRSARCNVHKGSLSHELIKFITLGRSIYTYSMDWTGDIGLVWNGGRGMEKSSLVAALEEVVAGLAHKRGLPNPLHVVFWKRYMSLSTWAWCG